MGAPDSTQPPGLLRWQRTGLLRHNLSQVWPGVGSWSHQCSHAQKVCGLPAAPEAAVCLRVLAAVAASASASTFRNTVDTD